MKPEKQESIDSDEVFMEMGVPKEWVEPLKALGNLTVSALQAVEKPRKLVNDLNGYKKKNKLDLPGMIPKKIKM